MRSIIWVLVVSVSLQAVSASVAQADPGAPVAASAANAVAPAPNQTELASRFLRAELSLWDTFGVKLSKNGQQVGPAFFSVIPDEAVAGSSEARRHAGHARVFHWVTLGLITTALGLFAGSVAARSSEDRWTPAARVMLTGSILGVFASGATATVRQTEMMAAVDAYNYDLVTGRLRD